MIEIFEKTSKKIPGTTSLFFKLPFYDKYIFDILIQSQNSDFNKVNNEFEFSCNSLYFIVNVLSNYDSIQLNLYNKVKPFNKLNFDKYKFRVNPYKHQLDAINYGYNNDSWLLLDDCGLGKTLTILYLAEVLKREKNLKHCLIICGVNSLKYNWISEIEKFSKLDYKLLGQRFRKNGNQYMSSVAERCAELKAGIKEFFTIVNIETLQNKDFINAFNKSKSTFDMIVVDEIHRCKDPTSKSAKTLLKLNATYKVGLTGTIIMNDPENSYVPLKWIGKTAANFSKFKQMFSVYGGFNNVQVIGYKNLDILQDLISACSLRRLKSDVLDLPPKIYVDEYVEMGSEQFKLYNEVSEGIAASLDLLDHTPTILEELSMNIRLRQITAYPGMLSTDTNKSAKLDRLVELVDDIINQGDKVVVFSTFKSPIYEAQNRLSNYKSVICTGDQDDITIKDNINIFQTDDSYKIFFGTWSKCGTGITLTAASYLIFIDTPYTDADFVQASDRIYRIGQKKPATIITLITRNTYDERVKQIIELKKDLSEYLVDKKSINKLNILQ